MQLLSTGYVLQYYGNLEVTLTIIERLRQLVGRQVTVYVSHVMRHQVIIPIHAVGAVSVGAPLAGPPVPPSMPPRPPMPPVGSL